ncbi:hypothetical protein B0H14DRAFT_2602895 [Mycena olivaceomarginata]|nr:hypothetical protein B0H14DRAFT_2602895 [Mycena olivaceomarginata]
MPAIEPGQPFPTGRRAVKFGPHCGRNGATLTADHSSVRAAIVTSSTKAVIPVAKVVLTDMASLPGNLGWIVVVRSYYLSPTQSNEDARQIDPPGSEAMRSWLSDSNRQKSYQTIAPPYRSSSKFNHLVPIDVQNKPNPSDSLARWIANSVAGAVEIATRDWSISTETKLRKAFNETMFNHLREHMNGFGLDFDSDVQIKSVRHRFNLLNRSQGIGLWEQ